MKHVDLSTDSGDVVPHFLVDRLDPFRTAFTTRTWKKSLVLVMGVLLAPGKKRDIYAKVHQNMIGN